MTEGNKKKITDIFSFVFKIIGFSGIILFLTAATYIGSYTATIDAKLVNHNEKIIIIEKRIDRLDVEYRVLNDRLLPYISETNQRLKSIENRLGIYNK